MEDSISDYSNEMQDDLKINHLTDSSQNNLMIQ